MCGVCGRVQSGWYDRKLRQIRDFPSGDMRIYLELEIRRIDCRSCQGVKQEKLDWLADNPFYTKRFAFYIGRRCRSSSIQDVAKEHLLDWRAVKTLEMQYMREQIKRAGQPRPGVIGIDELSIRKGHIYSIVVSDLERRRAIWFGGKDRSEESMDMFFAFLGERRSKRIRLAVMDMWKPFLKSTNKKAPQAAILFDKFHILRHLGDALDKVRKQEYAKLDGAKRKFIKGQKYALLSHKENLQGSSGTTTGKLGRESSSRTGVLNSSGSGSNRMRGSLRWSKRIGMESLPTASLKTKFLWALSKVSTTRSVCSSAGLTGYVTRNTSGSKYSAACCRRSETLSQPP